MASSSDANVFGEVKERWVNPLYREGIGRRTGRQLEINAGRDSEGFENFSDYWSDSAADSDISEFVGKENDTSRVLTDGRGGKYADAINRKLSSPLKAMQSFSSVSTKSGDPSSSSAMTGRTSTGSTLGSRSSSANTMRTDKHTTANPDDIEEEVTEDMTETDHAVAENQPAEDLELSGHVERTEGEGAATEQTTPLQESIVNEADITGSIIAVRTSQAPNSALQVFKTKKRLSFSTNEVEDNTSAHSKTSNKGKKDQSIRGKGNNDDQPQQEAKRTLRQSPRHRKDAATEEVKRNERCKDEGQLRNSKDQVRKSPRHTKATAKSSSSEEADDLDSTLTGASDEADSSTPTKEKRSSDEDGNAKEDTVTKSKSPNTRSTRSKSILEDHDGKNKESQEDQAGSTSKEDEAVEEGKNKKEVNAENDKKDNSNKSVAIGNRRRTQLFQENVDDSANASTFLTLTKSHLQTLPPADDGSNEEVDDVEGEIEIVEEPERETRRKNGKEKEKRGRKKKGKIEKSSRKTQSEEDDEKSSGSQTGNSSNSPDEQKDHEEVDMQDAAKVRHSKRGTSNKNRNKSAEGRKDGGTKGKQATNDSAKEETSEAASDSAKDDDKSDGRRISTRSKRGKRTSAVPNVRDSEKEKDTEEDERKADMSQSKSRRNMRSKKDAEVQETQEVENNIPEDEEEANGGKQIVEEEEVTSKPLRRTSRSAKGRKRQLGSQKRKQTSDVDVSTRQSKDDTVEDKMEEVKEKEEEEEHEEEEEIQPKISRRNTRSKKTTMESNAEVESTKTAAGKGRNKKTKKIGRRKKAPVGNSKKTDVSSEDENGVDHDDNNASAEDNVSIAPSTTLTEEELQGLETTDTNAKDRTATPQDKRHSTTPKVFELVQLAESMQQDNVSEGLPSDSVHNESNNQNADDPGALSPDKGQGSSTDSGDGNIVTVKKNITASSRVSSVADDGDVDTSDIMVNINDMGNKNRMSWQKTPSQLSPIKIDSYLEDYVSHNSDKNKAKKTSKVTSKNKQSKAGKRSKKKGQRKTTKRKKDNDTAAEDAEHAESSSSHEETEEAPSGQKRRQQKPIKRNAETDEEEEPVRKVKRPSPKQRRKKSQSPRTRTPSSSSPGEASGNEPTPKGRNKHAENSIYDYEYSATNHLDSDISNAAVNNVAKDSADSRRASCVMKMGAVGTTVVTVHPQREVDDQEAEENASPSTTPVTTASAGPTPKSILKRSGKKKGRLTNKRLTLQFFEVPKKKGFIVEPEKTSGLRRTARTRCQTLEYWRNERPLYERRKSGGFALVGIKSPTNARTPAPRKTNARISKKKRTGMHTAYQTPGNVSMHVPPPPKAEEVPHTAVTVINPETKEEVEVDAIITSDMHQYVGPSGKVAEPEDPISVCKCLHQQAFSSGILKVRGLKEKSTQLVRRNTMVFYIIHGKLSVTIHNTTQILQTGDTFFVPQGNVYSIQNLRTDEAKLKFFQLKNNQST